ncbi:MAG: hypothetical protein IAE86_19620 [Burkholderiaceae bacterium]|nr:hypothetical protein [Burkholderiaceae bacterium]
MNEVPVVRGLNVLRDAAEAPSLLGTSASPVRDRVRTEALRIARDEALVEAAYSYRIVPFDAPLAATMHAGGETLHAPRLLSPSGRLTALACAVCTLGPRIEERVRLLFAERRASLAMVLDELANAWLFEVSRRVQDRMHADVIRQGLSMAGELRPGDPGLALEAQPAVLRLVGAEALGVRVNERMLMQPHKSTSMVLGVGMDLPPTEWSRCDECRNRATCRAAARVEAQKATGSRTPTGV